MNPTPYIGLVLLLAVPILADEPVPQVFLDKSPAVVKYQLKRLSNEQLLRAERRADDPKYKPVYAAILTRKGMVRDFRVEAAEALAKLNGSDVVSELLEGIAGVEADDKATPRELASLLLLRPKDELTAQREMLAATAVKHDKEPVRKAAFAAFAVTQSDAAEVWKLAAENRAIGLLLAGLPLIPDPQVRAGFYPHVSPLVTQATDDATQLAAVEAIGYVPGHESETFKALAGIVRGGAGEKRAAAVRSIRRLPVSSWPKDQVEPLAKAIVQQVKDTPADERTTPAAIEAIQFGNDLAAAMPDGSGAPIAKSLRELGVRVVLIRTLREQMLYDLRYFVVEAGKPVRVLLYNDDFMPHNLVVAAPGSLLEIGAAAATLPPPSANDNKAYVPDSPKVLHATRLINADESDTLAFSAPATPGEYVYVCTFPGHFTRMYGVMLVVADFDSWERDPKPPTDPLLQTPIESAKHEAASAPHEHH